jgi:3-oxoadipate enol-lactonase
VPIANVAGTTFNYRFDGPDSSPVLMLSNSLGTNLAMWDPQIAALSATHRVLRYDSRGHGQSQVTPGPYSIEQVARDALQILDALHIERASLCGLSMGGMVGQWLGAHVPQRLDKLILCNTSALIGPPEIWNARIDAVQEGGMAAIVDAVLARWFTAEFRERAKDTIAATRAMLLASPAEGYVASCVAVRDMDQRASAERIAVPTLVIAGTHDVATPPADGRFLAERIKGARYAELPAAHLSNLEAAPAFTTEVTRFLAT